TVYPHYDGRHRGRGHQRVLVVDYGDRTMRMVKQAPTDRSQQTPDCTEPTTPDDNHVGPLGPVDKGGQNTASYQLRIDRYRGRLLDCSLCRQPCLTQDLPPQRFELRLEVDRHGHVVPHPQRHPRHDMEECQRTMP